MNKEQVRKFLTDRAKTKQPVPSMEEVRRQLGWHLKGTK